MKVRTDTQCVYCTHNAVQILRKKKIASPRTDHDFGFDC